ncbi:MAG: SNF2-related protein [Methylococcales bacterium]|nr:SNF2-related protein [Methylococcales bacterium]
MNEFIAGQCWISRTEPELGLGLVVEVLVNRVVVHFLASGEQRTYARDNTPLVRAAFRAGERLETLDGVKVRVTEVEVAGGLLTYVGQTEHGQSIRLEEMELNPHLTFSNPEDRLFTGQFDPPQGFELRYQGWQWQARHQQSSAKGLLGARAALLPHQLYIAHEAARREPPRILLADEVGLGKTIEAGLIIHHRRLNGLSRKVLVIVPEPILHQWLVEMLRRFNLRFTLLDAQRCADMRASAFAEPELVLCGQRFLSQNPDYQAQVLAENWDLVVIDEAHHLIFQGNQLSPDYAFAERLAQAAAGLILLTATPEQMGADSHFAQLRLLDPDRYYDFDRFVEEQKHFRPAAALAKALQSGRPLSSDEHAALTALLRDDDAHIWLQRLEQPGTETAAREALLALLLDLHGTGRVMFRNSRHTVKGFPDREVHVYPLSGDVAAIGDDDPRCQWLLTQLKALDPDKALLICREADTAKALAEWLKKRHGVVSALFHEQLSIIERDRAAAYFADPQSPARLLICSEIGSEGRNFQFLKDLILFDLPENPEVLQQRIGRLDRIGQRRVIQLHVPYVLGSREQGLYLWYHEGLNALRHNVSAAPKVAEQVADDLAFALAGNDIAKWQALAKKTRPLAEKLEQELHDGRDLLLELNSCRSEKITPLLTTIQALEQDAGVKDYCETLFDYFGIDSELHSPGCYILKPGKLLRPIERTVLPDDGVTVTYDRAQALAREDFQFLTLEHPLIETLNEALMTSELGNATVSIVKLEGFKTGQFLLECLFVAEVSAPPELHVGRFFPVTPIRRVLDNRGQDVTKTYTHQALRGQAGAIKEDVLLNVLQHYRRLLETLKSQAELTAQQTLEQLQTAAIAQLRRHYSAEVKRLQRLQRLNPMIQPAEIEGLSETALLLKEAVEQVRLRLDAVRFLVCA